MAGSTHCDVLVVGGGTSGCMAAWRAAQFGAKTILIEKSPQPYKPACAEGMSKLFADLLPFKVPNEYILHTTDSVYLWTKEIEIERKGALWKSYMIDRKGFQNWLWNKAKGVNAETHLSAEIVDLTEKESGISSVVMNYKGKEYGIQPKVIIAADGAHSVIRERLGLNSEKDLFGYVISNEYDGMNVKRPYAENLFLGDFAPYAYGYIFPKSETRANVGAGVISTRKKYKKDEHEDLYKNFCSLISNQIGRAKSVEERNGDIVIKFQNEPWTYKNVLFVGDAANQNIKPYVEGIAPGMLFGYAAGKIAASYTKNSYETGLLNYEKLKGDFSFIMNESKMIEDYVESLYEASHYLEFPNKMIGIFANLLNVGISEHMTMLQITKALQHWNNNELKQRLSEVYEYIGSYYLQTKAKSLFK